MACFSVGGFPLDRPSLKGDPQPCQFPFTFEGKKYTECADFSQAQPYMTPDNLNELVMIPGASSWCALTSTYAVTGPTKKMWGYCVCGISTDSPTSLAPTQRPNTTLYPTNRPTKDPTKKPTTAEPTRNPTLAPTAPTTLQPTSRPTSRAPTPPTSHPTYKPTKEPTQKPTKRPTTHAPTTYKPTFAPTLLPTTPYPTFETPSPTIQPSRSPTWAPTTKVIPPSQVLAIGAGVAATVAFLSLFVLVCFCWRKCTKSRRERRDTVVMTDIVPIQSVTPLSRHSRYSDADKPAVFVPPPKSTKKTPKHSRKNSRSNSTPNTKSPDDIESQKATGRNRKQSVPKFSLVSSPQPEMVDFGYSGRNAPLPAVPPVAISQPITSGRNSLPMPSRRDSAQPPPAPYHPPKLLPVVPSSTTQPSKGGSRLPPPPNPRLARTGNDAQVMIDDFGSSSLPPLPPPSRVPPEQAGGGFMAQMMAMLPRRESTSSNASSKHRNSSVVSNSHQANNNNGNALASASLFARVPNRKASTSSWASVEEKSNDDPPQYYQQQRKLPELPPFKPSVPVGSSKPHSALSKYERMQRAGLSAEAIKHAMVKDGVPLSAFPGLSHSGMI